MTQSSAITEEAVLLTMPCVVAATAVAEVIDEDAIFARRASERMLECLFAVRNNVRARRIHECLAYRGSMLDAPVSPPTLLTPFSHALSLIDPHLLPSCALWRWAVGRSAPSST